MRVPWRGRWGSRWAVAGLLIVVLIAAMAPGVEANPGTIGTTSGFEDDDGDLTPGVPTMTPPINFDWNSFSPVTWNGSGSNQQANRILNGWLFTGLTDAFGNNATDDVFGPGVDQNTPCPGVATSSGGSKDDLKRIYLAHKSVGGQVYLMLAWVRFSPNGTTSIMFEFNQGEAMCTNGSPFVQRSPGDFQILYDFQGSNPPQVTLSQRRWDSGNNSWAQQTALAPGIAEGAVNTGPVQDDLAPEALNDATLFGEAGVNLTAAGLFTPNTCQSFGSASAMTRASNSPAAQMKDLVAPAPVQLSSCGTLVIRKVTDPVPDLSNTSFPFVVDGPRAPPPTGATAMPAGPLNLTPGNDGSASMSMTVAPGTGYSVTETPIPANWQLASAVCNNGVSDVGTLDPGGHGVTGIAVNPDQTVTCTFTDTVAALALRKTTLGAVGGPFRFTVQPVSGQGGPTRTQEATTTAAGVPQPAAPLTAADATYALPPGSYLITETSSPPTAPGASWTPGDMPVCTSGNGNGTVPVTKQDGGFRIDLAVRSTVTCTFTNTFVPPPAAASLVLNKLTHGKTAAFTYTISSNGTTRTQVATTQAEGVPVAAMPGSPADATDQLQPGNYLITEASPTDPDGEWQGGTPQCVDGSNGPVTAAPQGDGYSVTLPPGAAVSCTFTNTFTPTPASLVLHKVTIGNTGQFTFTVRPASDQNGNTWTQVATTQQENSPVQAVPVSDADATNQLAPGTYLISESPAPSGGSWSVQQPVCTTGSSEVQTTPQPQSYDGADPYNGFDVSYSVTLPPGGVVTCTFTNTYTPPPGSLVIEKMTVAPDDLLATQFAFTLDGPSDGLPDGFALSNEGSFRTSVTPGSGFSATETVPQNWELTSASCSNDNGNATGSPTTQLPSSGPTASGVANISVGPGETVTCVFTDTLLTGAIAVTKTFDVPPPAGTQATFTITGPAPSTAVVGTLTTTGTSVECLPDLVLGTYTVTETDPPTTYAPSPPQTAPNIGPGTCTPNAPSATLTFTDTQLTGALRINKTFIPPLAGTPLPGATFSITGPTPLEPVTTGPNGTACVDGLQLGTYTITETQPPDNYTASDPQTVQVNTAADCASNIASAATVSFTDMAIPTATPTPTETPTSTETPASTETPLPTGTPPPTGTATPPPPGTPQIMISKSADPTYADVGGTITYTLVVTNAGGVAFETPTPSPTPTAAETPTAEVTTTVEATVTATETPTQQATGSVTAVVTGTPAPTDTPVPATDTPVPSPTDTPVPTDTPLPPANTPVPTDTPLPPANTPVPPPDTSQPEEPAPPPDTNAPAPDTNAPAPDTNAPAPDNNAPAPDNSAPAAAAPASLTMDNLQSASAQDAASTGIFATVAHWLQAVGGSQVVAQAGGTVGIPLVDVTVRDRLPDGVTFVSASDGGVYDSSNRTVTWLLNGLDPGASVTLSYTVTVSNAGYWTNAACAAGADEFGNVASDCADATISGGEPTRTPTPTQVPTSTPTNTPQPAAPQPPGPPPQRTPTPTNTQTLAPGAPTHTPAPTVRPTNTPSATSTPTSAPPGSLTPTPTPTLTTVEVEVEAEVIEIVEEREGARPQIPVQLPGT